MFENPRFHELMSKQIMQDRLREAEQHRLLQRAEAARRSEPGPGLFDRIRNTLAVRRGFVRPTTATS